MSIGRCKYSDGVFKPMFDTSRFNDGGVYLLDLAKDRSEKSHDQLFAIIADAWSQIPDHLNEWRTAEHLRKWATIRVGWCDVQKIACTKKSDAMQMAGVAKKLDKYCEVAINGYVLVIQTAKTIKRKRGNNGGMDAREFQRVKTEILNLLDEMLGLEPGTLARNGGQAA